jgi:hypothetical protein
MATSKSNAPIMPLAGLDERAFGARASLFRLLAAACSGPMAALAVPVVAGAQTLDAEARNREC